jgi:polar amino acid transport system permease protein
MDIEWRWDFALAILPRLLSATANTFIAAGAGYSIALIIGLAFALLQRIPFTLVNLAAREAVEFIRSTPLLLQVFFVFYVFPQFGVALSPWTAGMLALGLHYSAYLSEVYRAGIESVPQGQWEACRAINLTSFRTYTRIIIPQALPASLPGLSNYLVGIFKDTPMLSVIGVAELMHAANAIGSESYRFLEPYTLVGLIFLLISLPTAALCRAFERWLSRKMGIYNK